MRPECGTDVSTVKARCSPLTEWFDVIVFANGARLSLHIPLETVNLIQTYFRTTPSEVNIRVRSEYCRV
ncbi:hypothetical protein J6590_075252 [Homalodisca vitripennis]|nr:hypothetical protein J6590_075252 [Homalodisca vitripennis]